MKEAKYVEKIGFSRCVWTCEKDSLAQIDLRAREVPPIIQRDMSKPDSGFQGYLPIGFSILAEISAYGPCWLQSGGTDGRKNVTVTMRRGLTRHESGRHRACHARRAPYGVPPEQVIGSSAKVRMDSMPLSG